MWTPDLSTTVVFSACVASELYNCSVSELRDGDHLGMEYFLLKRIIVVSSQRAKCHNPVKWFLWLFRFGFNFHW